jgi:Cof subfamily protein (haloacid dehalogenase superfamily)
MPSPGRREAGVPELPQGFPPRVELVATDFDRTLIAEDGVLHPRTLRALAAVRDRGVHVIVVTGRMFRSVRPYLGQAGLTDPVVCYPGAVVADPVSGVFLRHVPLPLETAREAIAAVEEEGYPLNCYVDDLLYVARETPEARAYADFQHLEVHEVGDLERWLSKPPTKLVVVGEPESLDELETRLEARFDGRLYISKSLPFFLELAHPSVTKAAGLDVVASSLGVVRERTIAFGDGENDVELLEWAAFGIAVENAHERVLAAADWTCPPARAEGVAQVLEALVAEPGPAQLPERP